MRADRLLSILLLLQVNRRITTRELAKRLEVSDRTIHRDMDALCASGIPLIADRGVGGGWSLLEEYRTNLTGLNEGEIQALFLAQPARVLSDLGLHQAAEAARIKLRAALPAVSRQDAEHVRQRIHIDGAGWSQASETVPFLPAIQEAVWQDRMLLLRYQRADDTLVERLVAPLGLVAKGRVWYLIARIDDSTRTYRISRVRGAEIADETFARPPDFDLAAHWEASTTEFRSNLPQYAATVRIDAAIYGYLRAAGRYAQVIHASPPDEHGWMTLDMLFEGEYNACENVLGFGAQIEVIEPARLRDLVLDAARQIVARYERAG